MKIRSLILTAAILLGLAVPVQTVRADDSKVTIRAGHFPNITHAQGVIGQARGDFEKALGDKASIDWKLFNSGTSAIEALFAGELDITYIGPNPAVNGYIKSDGEALRIVSGAASGGAGFVVRKDAGIKSAGDFNGKKLATPSIGNTQDVALRNWLGENGYKLKEKGGTVEVVPLENPDQLTLFIKKEIDGAWTVEPWVSRLIYDGAGELFLDEKELWPNGQYVTTHIIVNTKFLKEHPDLVKTWLETNLRITDWINNNKEEAKQVLNKELKRETGKAIPQNILDAALPRIEFTYDPIASSLFQSAEDAYKLGFLGKKEPDLSNIYDLSILNGILRDRGLQEIKADSGQTAEK
ncbi:MAG TPA: ABC transporter substrate-binding protein [Thermodesulfobacteriota bacterium]|nr:ABC transporter substrate-binding protein [Thermodesulfobacteriota bacterium]